MRVPVIIIVIPEILWHFFHISSFFILFFVLNPKTPFFFSLGITLPITIKIIPTKKNKACSNSKEAKDNFSALLKLE